MNMDQVRNPHLIFPGQVLFLDKSDGRAGCAWARRSAAASAATASCSRTCAPRTSPSTASPRSRST
jgi:hypothetical protein